MGILNSFANIIKGYDFDEPIIFKESNSASNQVNEMVQFKNVLNSEGQELIDDDIRLMQAGIYGEDAILYELKNSHLPIVVLRDLQLKYKDLEAQIDFIILTPRGHLVIECKNMVGDIEVNSNGDFIRKYSYGKRTIKKGIYSPITQNRRHFDLLREIYKDNQKKFIGRAILDNDFIKMVTPIVLVANPKSVLNIKYAKKEIKEKILRLDQLNNKIRDEINKNNNYGLSKADLLSLAEHVMKFHNEKVYDFKEAYKNYKKLMSSEAISMDSISEIDKHPLYIALKDYRLLQSRKENIKPYFIFNNLQLEVLVKQKPKNKTDLLKINGFGEVKCDKYGNDILEIIKLNS